MYKYMFLVTCAWPFGLTPSATCANMLIDRNNCGKIGHKCNSTYKSCSSGVCGMAPIVQLTEPIIIWQGALNGSKAYGESGVTLPMNITLYNTTTNYVSVTVDGVSFLPSLQYSIKMLWRIRIDNVMKNVQSV
jgi:hypothetical protein